MVDEVVRVSLALDPAVMLAGLKEATTPAGRPGALNTTLWAAPAVTDVDIVTTAEEPRAAVNLAGLAATEKLFGAGRDTTRLPAAGLAVTEKSLVVVRETMQLPATLLNCFCTV